MIPACHSAARVVGGRLGAGFRIGLPLAGLLLVLASAADATEPRKVFSPIVEEGEAELETVGTVDHDRKSSLNGGQAYTAEVGYGVNSFWFTELEAEFKRDPAGRLGHNATAWENVLQVTPQGAYWMDFGVFAEYEIAAKKEDADEVIFGPLLLKELGDWLATANLLLDKQVGKNADEGTAFRYRLQLRYRWQLELEPGVEAYGEPGEIANFMPADQQTHQLGPVIFGRLPLGPLPGRLRYEVGYLFGLTPGTPEGSVKWRLEYEFRF